ncbi:ankyrin repeat-containing domain protein [Aspergillus ambiguus]|uniref:ankyrin repeat domain-containing protein n=1 Tax=Aspergillus ambiguus TaxID=176160 RepID=UPI003CCC8F6B
MSLLKLPNELLLMIGDACQYYRDLSALSCTSRFMYQLLNSNLYRNALRKNDGIIFLEALRDKKDGLAVRLVKEANFVHRFTWTKFCSIWYGGIPIRGTIRFLVAKEQNLDTQVPGTFSAEQILTAIVEESDGVGIDMLMEWKGDEILSQPEETLPPYIYYAASRGDIHIIERLQNLQFGIDHRGEDDRTPLMVAAANGHTRAVKALLEAGASVHLTDRNHGLTALGWALRRGRTSSTVRVLMQYGSDPNARDGDDRAILLIPLTVRFTKAVMPLLEGGVKFNPNDNHLAHFLFDFACQFGLQDVAQWVYDRHPTLVKTIEGKMPWYFLHHAIQCLSVKTVRLLLAWGADPNLPSPWNETPLLVGLRLDDARAFSIVKELLIYGADVNFSNQPATPLTLALRFPNKRAASYVKLFLRCGLDLDDLDPMITSELLSLAIDTRDIGMVRTLCEGGVDLDDGMGEWAPPIWQAVRNGYVHIVNYIIRHGATHDFPNRHGDTVLTWAISNNHVDTVLILLSMIDKEEDKEEIERAMFVATLRGYYRVTKVLVDAGFDLPEDVLGLEHLFEEAE